MKKTILLTVLGLTLSFPCFSQQKEDPIATDKMRVPLPEGIDDLTFAYFDIGINQPSLSCNSFYLSPQTCAGLIQTIKLQVPQTANNYITAVKFIYGISTNQMGN